MGLKGFYINNQNNLYENIKEAIDYNGPVLVHCKIVKNGIMSSLVAPGGGLDEQILNFNCDPDCRIKENLKEKLPPS